MRGSNERIPGWDPTPHWSPRHHRQRAGGRQRMDIRKGNKERGTQDASASRVLGTFFLFFFVLFLLIIITTGTMTVTSPSPMRWAATTNGFQEGALGTHLRLEFLCVFSFLLLIINYYNLTTCTGTCRHPSRSQTWCGVVFYFRSLFSVFTHFSILFWLLGLLGFIPYLI